MKSVVYNSCYGGFGLSHEAIMRYAELKGITLYVEKNDYGSYHYFLKSKKERKQAYSDMFDERSINRTDPALVQTVRELREKANGMCSKLRIEEIDDVVYKIEEYDGYERITTSTEWKF